MRVNYITPARKRHNVRIRRPRIAPAPQAPSLLPGFIPRTPRPFNAQRAESADAVPLPTPRSPTTSPTRSPDGKRSATNGETQRGRNGLCEPRFLPVHEGVRLGKPASPPRTVAPAKRPPVMRKHERPRFSFARPQKEGDKGGGGTYLRQLRHAGADTDGAPPRPTDTAAERASRNAGFDGDTFAPRVSALMGMPVTREHAGKHAGRELGVEQLLRMDLTGARGVRKRRRLTALP